MEQPELEPIVDEEDPESCAREDALEGAATRSTMPPSEALERLRRGETVERTKIIGLKLKGQFPLPVRLRNVTLVRFAVEKATFAEDVIIEQSTLDRPRWSRSSTYEKSLSLTGSTLVRADVRGLTVRGALRCENLRTRGRLLVEGCRFEGRVRFWEACFQGWAEFKKCEFVEEADFRSVHCDEGFIMAGCVFHSNFLFRGSTVHKKWQADTSRFEGMLDLSKAKLHDFVYLEGIEQGEKQRFAFTNALAERILIRPEQLEGRISSEEAGDHAQAMQEYGLLKRNFEGLHRYEQEDWAFYRFKVNQRRSKGRTWDRPWSKLAGFCDWLLLDHGCGYGTNPFRAIRAAILIILTFGLIYAVGVESLYVEHLPFAGSQRDFANRAMIGSLTSVSAFTSGFGDIRGAAHGWMNVPLIAESLMGTLLWGLFIVAFSRKVIR